MKAANEVRVGVVVVAALALMVVGYFFLRGVGLGADLYYLRLNGAANVSAGNDVRIEGVKVGQVQDVSLDPLTRKPLLTLAVKRANPRFELLRSYKYSVQTSGIIGENYVDIRGNVRDGASAYAPNDKSQIIIGQAPLAFADVTNQATGVVQDFRKTLGKFNVTLDRVNKGVLGYQNQVKLAQALDSVTRLTRQAGQGFGPHGVRLSFGDPRSANAMNDALVNASMAARQANAAARNINSLTHSFGGVVGENRSQLHLLLVNMNKASTNVAGLTETLNFVARKGGLRENTQIALTSLRRAAENLEAGTASFKTLASDPAYATTLHASLQSLQMTTEALRDTTKSIQTLITDPATQGQFKSILGTLNTVAGTLQMTTDNLRDTTQGLKNVFGDPQFQNSVKAIPANLNTTLTEAQGTLTASRSVAERLNSILGGRRKRNAPSQGGGTNAQRQGFAPGGFDFTYRHYTGIGGGPRTGDDVTGTNYGDVNFNAEFFGGPFRLGLANIGEGTQVTAQTGSFIGHQGAVRYGLYRSKLGVGADYHMGRFSLEGNLWNPNHVSGNAYLGYRITPQLEILAGHEKIRGAHTNAIGVRLTP